MNSTNANDDGTARALAAAQRDEFHTPTRTAADASNARTKTLKRCSTGRHASFRYTDAKHTHDHTDNNGHKCKF